VNINEAKYQMRHAFRLFRYGEKYDLEERISFLLDLQGIFTFLLQFDRLTRGSPIWAHKLFKHRMRPDIFPGKLSC